MWLHTVMWWVGRFDHRWIWQYILKHGFMVLCFLVVILQDGGLIGCFCNRLLWEARCQHLLLIIARVQA